MLEQATALYVSKEYMHWIDAWAVEGAVDIRVHYDSTVYLNSSVLLPQNVLPAGMSL